MNPTFVVSGVPGLGEPPKLYVIKRGDGGLEIQIDDDLTDSALQVIITEPEKEALMRFLEEENA
jgi:hypothetical protein